MVRRSSRPAALSREDSLDSRPVQNTALSQERRPDGTVLLRAPFKPTGWVKLLARLLRMPDAERRLSLDEIGTYVWDQCDGKATVRDLIGRVAEKCRVTRKEAEVSVAHYLRTLAKKGLLGIMVPGRASTNAREEAHA
jgi:hypothetical protein